MNELLSALAVMSAAGLGAGFHALWTLHGYIKDRTYDPAYNHVYVIRMVLGTVSGTILGYALKDVGAMKELDYGTTVLGLLGGWSADAVAQILQRMSDTLVAAVRGPESGKVDVEVEKARADAAKQGTRKQAAALQNVREGYEHAVSNGASPETIAAMKKAIEQLESLTTR